MLFSLVAVTVAVVIVRTARRLYSTAWAITLGLVLGGAMGNLIDRIFRAPGFLRGASSTSSRFRAGRAALPGVQPRRLGDHLRRRPGRLPRAPRDRVRRDARPRTGTVRGSLKGSTARARHNGNRSRSPGLHRALPVPDGLEGLRVDAGAVPALRALAHRRRHVADGGGVLVDGGARGKATGSRPGAGSRSSCPSRRTSRCRARAGRRACGRLRRRRHRGGRQAGRRRGAPEPRAGTGPTVIGGARRGRVTGSSTSGAAERQGVVHRLDVGTTGLMVVAKSERAYTRAQGRVQGTDRREALPRAGAGPPRSARAARSTPRSAGTRRTTGSSPSSPAARRASPTTRRSRRSRPPACSRSISRPAAPTRSGCTCRRSGTRCVGDLTYGADPTLAARLGLQRQWLHAVRLGFAHPADGAGVEFTSDYPADLARALECCARET